MTELGSNDCLAPWFVPLRAGSAQPRLRLFMFPFAGGGPAALRAYASAWPADIDPFAAQLPGRERRIREPLMHRASDAAQALADALRGAAHGLPFLLFGHSMGAVLAFETARRLQACGAPLPLRLVVSGFALGRPRDDAPWHRRPDAEFTAALQALGGTAADVLKHQALMELMLPTLRADFEIAETYHPPPGPGLRCGITALAGDGDLEAPPGAMDAWGRETDAGFETHVLHGGHFFITERVDEIVKIVCRATATVAGPTPGLHAPIPSRCHP